MLVVRNIGASMARYIRFRFDPNDSASAPEITQIQMLGPDSPSNALWRRRSIGYNTESGQPDAESRRTRDLH
jgi:hypothetical protein